MKETIYNIFPISVNKVIRQIGFRAHDYNGTDREKLDFLLSKVEEDFQKMALIDVSKNFRVKLPNIGEVNGVTLERFNNISNNGTSSVFFEPIFQLFSATQTPLTVITMIIDGEIKIDKKESIEPIAKTEFIHELNEEIPEHYLSKFMTETGFDLKSLIDTDFLDAIKLLFDNKKYISSLKLLIAAVDTIAFLEYGDVPNNFKNWVEKFCSLSKISISEDELWEYRNSLLHMTNAYSRKVLDKKVKSLSFYVSEIDAYFLTEDDESKYFNFKSLYNIIIEGINNWCEIYKTEAGKFTVFYERYDLIVSDSRYINIKY